MREYMYPRNCVTLGVKRIPKKLKNDVIINVDQIFYSNKRVQGGDIIPSE